MAFFKVPAPGPAADWRAQLAQLSRRGRVQFSPTGRRHGGKGFFLPLINAFGVDVKGTRRSLDRAAFSGQAQGSGPEGVVVAPTFVGGRAVFHNMRKVRPYSIRIFPTTSAYTVLSGSF
jgi:hypothetical protein